jgi:hypothetical protein
MLEYDQDFTQKIVIVVNKSLETWEAFNATAHIAAYIGNQLGGGFNTGEFFTSKDSQNYPRNTQYPIVILRAKPGQLANLMDKARTSRLLYNGFIREMIETTDDREIIEKLASKDSSEIEYLGVGIFGPKEEVGVITKAYQLWR